MPLLSRIFGWAPPHNEDFVDIQVASSEALLPLQNPTFHISEPTTIRRPHRKASGIFESTSPASSTSALSTDSHTDERVDNAGKHGDPSWVARPRNEFILFRCDYVRKHSREGKRIRRAPGGEAEKTLSKQAAEAWHHLPPEERLYWKERANGERNEHARRYPDYRYRPKTSSTGRRRQTRFSPSKQSVSPEKYSGAAPPNTPLSEHASLPTSREPSKPKHCPSKLTPRRSSSAPRLAIEKDTVTRRLRSTASQGWIAIPGTPSSPTDRFAFGPPSPSREYTPIPSRLHSAPSFDSFDSFVTSEVHTACYSPQTPESSMHSASSSLLNWNGEHMVSAAPQPTQFLSSTSVSLSSPSRSNATGNPQLTEYTSGGNPIAPSQLFAMDTAHYYPTGGVWMCQPSMYPADAEMLISTASGGGRSEALGQQMIQAQEASSATAMNYGMDPWEPPINLLGESSPETLFTMDFNSNF